MYKTDLDANLDSRYSSKLDNVSSRFLNQNKKKYYLAGIDQNYNQLKEEQIKELTGVLTSLKSEYDALIRETTMKKKETDKLGKQIEMLEKIDKKTKNKYMEKEESNSNLQGFIELKKSKKEDETFQKTTLTHQMEKMKDEIFNIKKEINLCETDTHKLNKLYGKERIKENIIKDKINQLNSRLNAIKNKNVQEKLGNNLVLNYYNNVIDQKWSFIHSADERKEKQIRIAQEAKNDTQDKQEVEKRKVLSLCLLYNKYLRKKMEKELNDNTKLEETFQTIKDITGSSNLKTMVDKILSKDKNYNSHVSKVTEKEIKIEILRKDINALEAEYQKLKNDYTDESLNETEKESRKKEIMVMEEDELRLIAEEKELQKELRSIQDKHKDVKLVYEKVVENIKLICKMEGKKPEEVINHSLNMNNSSEGTLNDIEETSQTKPSGPSEEDLAKSFFEYLENAKAILERLYVNVGKKEFESMLKERGDRVETAHNQPQSNREKIKERHSKKHVSESKSAANTASQTLQTNYEYDYSDEDLKEDDKKVREEYAAMALEFKKLERLKFMESLKTDKEKK